MPLMSASQGKVDEGALQLTGVLVNDMMALLRRHPGASVRGGLITGDSVTGCTVSLPQRVHGYDEQTGRLIAACSFDDVGTQPLPEVRWEDHVDLVSYGSYGSHDGDEWSIAVTPGYGVGDGLLYDEARIRVWVAGRVMADFKHTDGVRDVRPAADLEIFLKRACSRAETALWVALREPGRRRS